MPKKEILILGAGVSGLYSAFLLKQAGIPSLILEGNSEAGRKLCLTGGGYGNLTNTHISPENYVGQDPNFTQYALKKFPYKKALDLFYTLDIPLEERDFGQIFSLIPATAIRDRLSHNLNIINECEIYKARYNNSIFSLESSKGTFSSQQVILALGSSAYPQINASSRGLDIADDFDLAYTEFTPALTPFILPHSSPLRTLSGISLDVEISLANKKYIRPLLFTHTGISGPAVLLLSLYHKRNTEIEINFLPNKSCIDLCHDIAHGKLLLKNLLSRYMPDRLVFALLSEELLQKKVAELSKKERQKIVECVHKHTIRDFELASLQKAEVAKNGILTKEINPQTMEALTKENLYITGEVMDITGHLGGYNIHWALASAYIAVQDICKKYKLV